MSSIDLATWYKDWNVSVEQESVTNAFPRSTDIIQV